MEFHIVKSSLLWTSPSLTPLETTDGSAGLQLIPGFELIWLKPSGSQGEGLQEDGVAAVGNHAGLLSVPGIASGDEADLRTTREK